MHTFRHVFNMELKSCLESEFLDIANLQSIVHKIKKWEVGLSKQIPFKRIINEMVRKNLEAISVGANGIDRLGRLNHGLEMLKELGFDFDLYQAQNMYFHISKGKKAEDWDEEWKGHFSALGNYLGVKVNY